MNINNVMLWVGLFVAIFGHGVTYGINNEKISTLEEKIEDQDALKEKAVRIEERQIHIQEDVKKILEKLDED